MLVVAWIIVPLVVVAVLLWVAQLIEPSFDTPEMQLPTSEMATAGSRRAA